ncbi:hypothetical protein AC481_00210 [miscellaneous Crenarchaeota group archaeon SMTZ-80]|nr:MAG: hypothetical protein AC481_00210 [miscellaneous Crenarchaeota group archaeon SMTZ-80]
MFQIAIIINYSLQLVWIVLQLIVGIFLLVKMIKTKRYNLSPLILFFIISSTKIIFFTIFPSLLILFLILIQFPNILLLIFTKLTFFKYKKSAFKILLLTLIAVRSIDFIIRSIFRISIPMTYYLDESNLIYYFYILFSITISYLFSHFWLGLIAFKYYNSIKPVNIEPYVKRRYQLIALGSLIYFLSIFLYYLIPYNVIGAFAFPNIIYSYIILAVTIFYSMCMFIAWIMPKRLKRYYNRNFERPSDKEYDENELMEIINKELKKDKLTS